MPAKPRWYRQIPHLRAAVEALESPLLDRAAIQKLFKVSRRQAQYLMKPLGGFVLGNAYVCERVALARHLLQLETGEAFAAESERRRRLRDVLRADELDAQARRIRFEIAPSPARRIEGLPETIRIAPGELHIRCSNAKDLLQQLYLLSRTIAQDFPVFEALVGGESTPPPSA